MSLVQRGSSAALPSNNFPWIRPRCGTERQIATAPGAGIGIGNHDQTRFDRFTLITNAPHAERPGAPAPIPCG